MRRCWIARVTWHITSVFVDQLSFHNDSYRRSFKYFHDLGQGDAQAYRNVSYSPIFLLNWRYRPEVANNAVMGDDAFVWLPVIDLNSGLLTAPSSGAIFGYIHGHLKDGARRATDDGSTETGVYRTVKVPTCNPFYLRMPRNNFF